MPDRLVLAYHAVSRSTPSRLCVTAEALRLQVSSLRRRGYRATTFNRAVLGSEPGRCFAVTFDDGERNVLEHGYPVLADLGVPATVFVPVATVGSPAVLDWDGLRRLADAGWEIGSHTLSHALLTELEPAALDRELRESRELLEEALGRPCRSIAYPYGAVEPHVRAAAAAAGYTAGCTLDGNTSRDPLTWPRVGIDGHDGRLLFRLKTSRTGRALRRSHAGAVVDGVGRAARSLGARRR